MVREPAAGTLGPDGARYAAAVAMGDGAPAFALGTSQRPQDHASTRLGSLCDALAGIAGGMGLTPDRDQAIVAADACRATLADAALRVPTASHATSHK